MEVACSSESRLSQEVQRLAGYEEAAVRCSHWNNFDLETSEGVKGVIRMIDELDPQHAWISPVCGPYSPLQSINQRTQSQIDELAAKRKRALKQYIGASCIYQYCIQKGIHTSWEWSEKCQGWRLPFMQQLQKKYSPFISVTHGCRVGLRCPKTHTLLQKGWKVMSTHQRISDLLNRRCMCQTGYRHAKCEGGLAGMTSYYTDEFAKLVCQGIFQEVTLPMLHREMEGRDNLPPSFGHGHFCVCQHLHHHECHLTCGSCLQQQFVGIQRPDECMKEHAMVQQHLVHEKSVEDIQRKLYLLHAATGHCNTRHLVDALKRRGANKQILEQAKNFRCAICEESRRVNHKHAASLEPLPPKLAAICADGGKWTHPVTNEDYEFVLIIDEGSRFRVAKVLARGKHQTMNAAQFLDYMQEGWIQYFGPPHTLRLDPSGVFRSNGVEQFCDRHGIFLDVIPGEAHWKIGSCEQAVRSTKEVMTKLAQNEPDLSVESALAEAIRVSNHREIVRGFSPAQHLLGLAPDETGRFISSLSGDQAERLLANPSQEFQENWERMRVAEQALIDWQTNERITRAMNSKAQPKHDYRPGDLVYFWRKQVSGRQGNKNGQFLGPARILATETKRQGDGTLTPGSSVWCVRGRRLIKCCPEQLRPASQREELVEHLVHPNNDDTPWVFPRIVSELGGNEFLDISAEVPDSQEWHNAQDPRQALQPTHRHRHKRAVSQPATTTSPFERASSSTENAKARRTQGLLVEAPETSVEQAWWNTLDAAVFQQSEGGIFWSEERASVEIAIDMPESKRGMQAALEDLTGFFVGALKRRAVEVNERKLSAADYQAFQEAKHSEVKNFIAAKAFEALPPGMRPTADQVIGMRWILTWKMKDDGELKPKARAILKGFQDPQYEHRATTTPVMTKQTRQFLLHETARRRWKVRKGDVTGAFLQGREYPGELFCLPCPEILRAMNLAENEVVKVKRGCYGLVDAPLEWYRSISSYLQELGLVKSWADPCCWFWKPKGSLRGMVAGHVDDFLFSGDPEDQEWQILCQKIQERYKWSAWEENSFVQCGVLIEEQKDGSFHLSQPRYIDKVSEIQLTQKRRNDFSSPTNDWEKSQLRSVLGAISWHAQQVAPHFAAEVSLLLSDVVDSTIQAVVRTNQLLQSAKARKDHKMIIHAFPASTPLGLYVWADAAGQNRRDGGSTQGIFLGLAPLTLSDGCIEKITPIAWQSSKIDRVARSPGAAEAKAVVTGEDQLFHARFQYGELLSSEPNIFDVDGVTNEIFGCIISDSRNVYDKLNNEELSTKGAERRTDIELLCVKSSQKNNQTKVRWVHSEAQLGNALTKANTKELEMFYRMGHQWRIVHDPFMKSAKKRRSEGINTLQQQGDSPKNSVAVEKKLVGFSSFGNTGACK